MNQQDQQTLRAEYPEAPPWVLSRDHTLKEARDVMALRRYAFPETKPKASA